MWLVRQTKVKLDPAREIVVWHLCYSAAKVWNAVLYERIRFLSGHGKITPDLHSQTISLQSNIFFLQLGRDIAIEVPEKGEWAYQDEWGLLTPVPTKGSGIISKFYPIKEFIFVPEWEKKKKEII